jgi:hypothetical protein
MMDNAKVEEQYKLYKLRQAEKDQEKTAEKQENERKRAEKDAFWKAKVEQAIERSLLAEYRINALTAVL